MLWMGAPLLVGVAGLLLAIRLALPAGSPEPETVVERPGLIR